MISASITLPVSGVSVALRQCDGADDMMVHEAASGPVKVALSLLQRLVTGAVDVATLVVTDFEFLLLSARIARFGPAMALGFGCPFCGNVAELSFSLPELLASETAMMPRGISVAEQQGWYRLGAATFRLPLAGDLAAVESTQHPETELWSRCAAAGTQRRQVDRAMAAMAPAYSRDVQAHCPVCSAEVTVGFSVPHIVMAEMRRAARRVYEEVDAIAGAYHWPEAEILALPQARRRLYAERIQAGNMRRHTGQAA